MDRVLEAVRPRIVPSPEEEAEVQASADRLLDAVEAALDDLGVEAEPLLVGSLAKGTWIRTKLDIDCFLLFDPSTPREAMEQHGLDVGHAVLDGRERYAEHPYVHGTWEGHEADVVPCFAVGSPSERMSAVDRTPFHNRYVVANLDDAGADEVRILKQFMHGIEVYGAKTKRRGFSGYLAELMVIHLGSFAEVLEAAEGWGPGTTLDPAGHAARDFDEPLVFVDPVDGGRNAAAAVSEANLRRFAEASAAFLADPDPVFFFPPDPPVFDAKVLRERLAGDDRTTLGLAFPRPDVVEDNLYPQLRKAQGAVARVLEEAGFAVLEADHFADDDRCLVLWQVEPARLEPTYDHPGPPLDVPRHGDRFRDKWEDHPDAAGPVREEDGRLVVEVRRRRRDPDDVVEAELADLALGSQVAGAVRDDHELLVGEALVRSGNAPWLSAFLDDRRPWERGIDGS